MAKRVYEIAMLRAEARFAVICGAVLLALGLGAAGFFTMLAWPVDGGVSPFAGPIFAAPPILIGWGICAYASGRLERARKLEAGESVARRPLAAPDFIGISRAMLGRIQKPRQGRRQDR